MQANTIHISTSQQDQKDSRTILNDTGLILDIIKEQGNYFVLRT